MSLFSHDCPHKNCAVRNSGFNIVQANHCGKQTGHITAICRTCHGSVIFVIDNLPDPLPKDANFIPEMIRKREVTIVTTYPQPDTIFEIDHVPERIYAAFIEAEENRLDKRYLSAAMGYRTTLERLLKLSYPEHPNGSLFHRIEHIASNGILPDSLTKFMHEVRFLGNEIHEIEDPTPEDVLAGSDFVRLLLTYLYELPKRVELAAERRAASKSQS